MSRALRVSIGLGLILMLGCAGGASQVQTSDPLLAAAQEGDLEALRSAAASSSNLNVTARGGETAMHLAANAGHAEAIRVLADAGADPNAAEYDGDTALHNAAVLGYADVVAVLLAASADPTMKSSKQMTAAQHARRAGHPQIARTLDQAAKSWRGQAQSPSGSETSDGSGPAKPLPRRTYKYGYDRRIAAVVGIDEYTRWPQLAGAVGDAKRVAQSLRDVGFDSVHELYGKDATRPRILDLLGTHLAEEAQDEDFVLIFFAGHGHTETLPDGEQRGYIVPVESDPKRVFSSGISMEALRDLRSRIRAKHVYYVMDSCYSGLLLTRGLKLNKADPNYFEKVTSKPSVQIITAGSAGEEAIERDGAGLFTTYFIEAIRGKGDLNGDGYITSEEISVYVKPRVTKESSSKQTPVFGTLDGQGEIVFKTRN